MPPDNSILDDVRAAAAEVAMPADTPIGIEPPVKEAPEAAAPAETAEQAAERARDDKGRFAKEGEKRETLTLKEKPAVAPAGAPAVPSDAAASAAEQQQPAPKPADEPILPPAEWKGAGKVQWNKLPKAVQQEMRETYESVAAAKAEFEPLSRAIAPHRDVLVRDAGSVESGINQLMQFYRAYLDNPQGLIQHIARTRGIDLGAPQGQSTQGTPQAAPDINSLIEQAVQQRIAPIQQQFEQARSQPVLDLIASARTDPKYPYFNDVVNDLEHYAAAERAHLSATQPGKQHSPAEILDGAYQRATRAHPVIGPQLIQQQVEETVKAQAAQAATARKAAAASLTGAPIAGAGAQDGRASKTESARDTVLKAYREQIGA